MPPFSRFAFRSPVDSGRLKTSLPGNSWSRSLLNNSISSALINKWPNAGFHALSLRKRLENVLT
jgi:hypothetical protein